MLVFVFVLKIRCVCICICFNSQVCLYLYLFKDQECLFCISFNSQVYQYVNMSYQFECTVVLWSYGSHFLILRLMVRARPIVWSQATGNCLQMLDLFYIWLKWLLCTNEPIKLSKDSSCQVFLQYWCRHPKHSKLQAKKGNASDNIYDKEKETGGNIQILREGSFAKLGGEVTRTEFKFARGTTDPWVDIII